MTIAIGREEIHVWYVDVRDCLARYSEKDLLAILPENERAQCLRSPLEKVRQERLVARALVRFGHSWYVDAAPRSWRFQVNTFGRPEFVPREGHIPLRFNASHSHDLVACAFAVDRDVGVDVEDSSRPMSPVKDISRFLSRSERAHLAGVPDPDQRHTFFSYWTLKEAYAKAHGIGLALGFDTFSIDLTQDPPVLVSETEAERWRFALRDVGSSHVVGAAARQEPGENLEVIFRPVVALR